MYRCTVWRINFSLGAGGVGVVVVLLGWWGGVILHEEHLERYLWCPGLMWGWRQMGRGKAAAGCWSLRKLMKLPLHTEARPRPWKHHRLKITHLIPNLNTMVFSLMLVSWQHCDVYLWRWLLTELINDLLISSYHIVRQLDCRHAWRRSCIIELVVICLVG